MYLAQLCAGSTIQLQGVVAALRRFSSVAAQFAHHDRESQAGQPSPWTHPELLQPGELQPGVTAQEIQTRRHRLCSTLPADTLAVLPAADIGFMSGVIPNPYRQDADFLYLTGINQRAVAVLQNWDDGSSTSSTMQQQAAQQQADQGQQQQPYKAHKFLLFIPPPDDAVERWDGTTLGRQAAKDMFGAHEVHYIDELPDYLRHASQQAAAVMVDDDRPSAYRAASIRRVMQDVARQQASLMRLRPYLHSLRWRKSAAEVELMRRSARAASMALQRCMQLSYGGTHEAHIAATFEYECKMAGAQRMAYPPVVAGGPDACTVHYSRNDKPVAPGQLLLMDAGCELHGYASDVTRTWPVSGRFTGPQRDVYELVLEVHQACLQAARPGTSIRKLHDLSVRLLCDGIHSLRIMPQASLEQLHAGLYRKLYWHSVGHFLGLDTHDTATVGHDRTLEASAVITLEPGLYIPNDARFGAFRGIGVRIEDDVLMTSGAAEVLSCDAPVQVADVEQLVRGGGGAGEAQLAYNVA